MKKFALIIGIGVIGFVIYKALATNESNTQHDWGFE